MKDFLEKFYGVLISPDETFDLLKKNPSILQGFFIVLAISVTSPVTAFNQFDGARSIVWFALNIITAAFTGILSWMFFASFLDILASIFKQSGRIKEFLTLSAFALIPWLFIAPAELFKTAGIIGGIFGVLLELLIWLWATILIVLAISKTYEISFSRVIVLVVTTFLGGFLAFNWIAGFFSTLIQILKV